MPIPVLRVQKELLTDDPEAPSLYKRSAASAMPSTCSTYSNRIIEKNAESRAHPTHAHTFDP